MSQADFNRSELLLSKRFTPFFITQFLGAFNDNLFKQGLITLISFGAISLLPANTLNNIAALAFIAPFFLFSALAGQIADKFDKDYLMRRIKLTEIIIMSLAAIGFMTQNIYWLLFVLFLMGAQSTFFGPIKYSIIPQHLKPNELITGNAWVEMGTFIAIIIGYVAGVLLTNGDMLWGISSAVIFVAIIGWMSSRTIPAAPAADPNLKINWNLFTESKTILGYAQKERSVFLSILGISWFWFLGAAYITQFPIFARDYLAGTETTYVLLLTLFSIGIGFGSMLCERFSFGRVELGLVPLGALGISVFGIDMFYAYTQLDLSQASNLSIKEFLAVDGALHILSDLFLIGTFGGFYIVPLYAMVQTRTDSKYRSRIIAANNILNALFMLASAASGIFFISVMELTIPEFLLVLAIMNIAAASFIFTVVPEFVMRFIIWIMFHTMYRVKHTGLEKIPEEGPAVLVCNHVSYVDALLLAGACKRPVRFVMFKPIYHLPVLNFIFRTGKAIPIDSKRKNPEAYEKAFDQISEELNNDEVVCIFPEGKLTADGEIDEFKNGLTKILERNPVPVVPMALKGLWGSVFSNKDGPALSKAPKRFWSRIELAATDPVPADQVTLEGLHEKVSELRGDRR